MKLIAFVLVAVLPILASGRIQYNAGFGLTQSKYYRVDPSDCALAILESAAKSNTANYVSLIKTYAKLQDLNA